jgi:hypothetical protein
LQEAQRAAKADNKGGEKPKPKKGGSDNNGGAASKGAGTEDERSSSSSSSSTTEGGAAVDGDGQVNSGGSLATDKKYDEMVSLFSHLPQPKHTTDQHLSSISSNDNILPAMSTLGHLYPNPSLLGGNARCRAMLQTFALLLQSYTPPPDTRDFRVDVDHSLLKPARPLLDGRDALEILSRASVYLRLVECIIIFDDERGDESLLE